MRTGGGRWSNHNRHLGAGERASAAFRDLVRQSRAVDPHQDASETSMPQWPRGTVTFLCTDIEGSTALWERDRQAMAIAVERHLALLDEAIAAHDGIHFKTVGDAVQVAFHTASSALAAAIAGQQAILAEPWPEEIGSLRVRMALYVGTAEPAAGD